MGFIAAVQALNQTDLGRWVNRVDYNDREERERFLFLVRAVRPRYDILIVSYHGDREYSQTPDPGKRAFFRQLAQCGADIVVGHHPHVVQGYEVFKTRGRDALLMYSMGNFISGMTWRLDPSAPDSTISLTGESYLLSADFDWVVQSPTLGSVQQPDPGVVESPTLSSGSRFTLEGATPIPIANYRNERGEMVVAKLSDLASGRVKLPRAWTAYYAGRLAAMESFLSRFPLGTDTASRAAAGLAPDGR